MLTSCVNMPGTYEFRMSLEMKVDLWKRRAQSFVESPSQKINANFPSLKKIILTSPEGKRTCLVDRMPNRMLSPRAMRTKDVEERQHSSRKRNREVSEMHIRAYRAKRKYFMYFKLLMKSLPDKLISCRESTASAIRSRDGSLGRCERADHKLGIRRAELQNKLGFLDVSLPEIPHEKLASPYPESRFPVAKRERRFGPILTCSQGKGS